MKKLSIYQMEGVTAGRDDSDCGWAAGAFVVNIVGGVLSGGWGLLTLPFTGRNVMQACNL